MANKRVEIDWSDEYNSSQSQITITEYGRNVQKLVEHAKSIANPAERQAFAERIIWLMQQISPQSRNVEDYREKLWKHLFRIADYGLEVSPPEGIVVKPEDAKKHPEKVPYPESQAQFRHYGHNVQRMIQQALEMPEGPKRDGFIAVIGAYMKLAYKTWNREHYVSDEVIKSDLANLSGGQIVIDDAVSLDDLAAPNGKKRVAGKQHGGGNQQRPNFQQQGSFQQRGGRMRQQQHPGKRHKK
jgi:hypothetical protein